MSLTRTPIYRALYRPNLLAGGERELVLTSAILCSGVGVSGLNFVSAVIGFAVWVIIATFLRMMAKADPYMSKVYFRHLRYQHYYPARSRPFCKG